MKKDQEAFASKRPTGQVILVDGDDQPVGVGEKMKTHREGLLHRAFSVLVFNSNGDLLLQQRAAAKYHSGGLWSNTCCSHPRPGEDILQAAQRRLREEMGFCCALQRLYSFTYRARLDGDLIEHEHDHVLIGRFDGMPVPDEHEVGAWKWCDVHILAAHLAASPGAYTPWFRLIMQHPSFRKYLQSEWAAGPG